MANNTPHFRHQGRPATQAAFARVHPFPAAVKLVRNNWGIDLSFHKTLQILSVTILKKNPVLQAFPDFDDKTQDCGSPGQLQLFNW
ncbi:MAG: hypothetical protein ACRD18_14400 [Terriglobia bacterium]